MLLLLIDHDHGCHFFSTAALLALSIWELMLCSQNSSPTLLYALPEVCPILISLFFFLSGVGLYFPQRINSVTIPHYLAHFFIVFLLLVTGHWFALLLNVPLVAIRLYLLVLGCFCWPKV